MAMKISNKRLPFWPASTRSSTETEPVIFTSEAAVTPEVDYVLEDLDSSPADADGSTLIQLNGDSATVEGPGAALDGSTVTIANAGTYQISSMLNDGQIIVDTQDAENVTLILAGADNTYLGSAPIYVANAEKVILTLAEGSENVVTDGAGKDDLKITGGRFNVEGQ